MSIPKIIHYCWFGGREKSELIEMCIASWHRYCPEWTIIEWNESNFDVGFCPYAANAYKQKRYGFLTDAARLKIIYENGGVYLDTDVELKKSMDELLENEAWFAYGTISEINTGSGFGATKGHPFIQKLLNQYLIRDKNMGFELCTRIDTEVFKKEFPGFAGNHDIAQEDNGVIIINDIWRYSIHHYTSTWMSPQQRIITKLRLLIRKIVKI